MVPSMALPGVLQPTHLQPMVRWDFRQEIFRVFQQMVERSIQPVVPPVQLAQLSEVLRVFQQMVERSIQPVVPPVVLRRAIDRADCPRIFQTGHMP
jgi:hypothetical protein